MDNPDVGARTVSDRIALGEARLAGSPYVTGLIAASGVGLAASGDGRLWRLAIDGTPPAPEPVLDIGALPLAMARSPKDDGAIVGADDGRVLHISPDGSKRLLAYQAGAWIDQIAVHASTGQIAFAVGRRLIVLDETGAVVAERGDHASTVAGIAFSGDGARIAASHYGGVSIWPTSGEAALPERLEWHGSHLAVAWSPDSAFIATAMQEKELHAWRMPQGKSLRMSGYPAKIRTLSWTADSRRLAVSGADVVTAWDFADGGPSGKAPLEFGYVFNQVTTAVAANPTDGRIAGAYDDGSILIGDAVSGDAIIARAGDGAAVVALSWTPDGQTLLAGGADGVLAVMRQRDTATA